MFSMKKILAIAGAGAMLVSVAACGSGTAGDDGGKKEISFQTGTSRTTSTPRISRR